MLPLIASVYLPFVDALCTSFVTVTADNPRALLADIRHSSVADVPCRLESPMMRQVLDHAEWTVQAVGDQADLADAPPRCRSRRFDARVPGCVHLDLMRAGVIGDPCIAFNERRQFWVGKIDWEYRCRFNARPGLFSHDRLDLVCDGLDTIASLSLNGAPIGDAANMFHPHRFDVARSLTAGQNELVIRFRSPLKHIRAEEARLGSRPVNGDWDPYIFIRKAACNFGWDWGPKVPTAGVWRSVRLEAWSDVRIASVRPLVRAASSRLAVLDVVADVEHAPVQQPHRSSRRLPSAPDPVVAEVSLQGPAGFSSLTSVPLRVPSAVQVTTPSVPAQLIASIKIKQPHRWWPVGHGEQPLYKLTVRLRRGKRIIDASSANIGLRTASLDTRPDAHGSRFQFKINGKPIFCKGANWIPDGLFAPAITPRQLKARIGQAAEAGMNMLRVWGGGYYEDEAFYRECDRRGIMVWQDFMFACAMYPQEPPYPALIEQEARHNVSRLSAHPSVVLWCGGNECIWGYQRWGWRQRLKPGQTWGKAYYLKLLPMVLEELDPTRPYWPNSPWSGSMRRNVLDENHGDRHTWDAQFDAYRDTNPRFLSEFGRQAPANIPTLASALPAKQLQIDSEAMTHRQRATGGNALMYAAIGDQLRQPRDFEEWTYASQLLQARALRIGLEWARANQPRCMGVLPWQLNDCWPALSWSLIDSAGRPKPAMLAARDAFVPRLAMIHLIGPERRAVAYVANDTDAVWATTLMARRVNTTGEVLSLSRKNVRIGARRAQACWDLQKALGAPGDPSTEYIELVGYPASATFFVPDVQVRYPTPRWKQTIQPSGNRVNVEIIAGTALRDLAIVGSACEGVKRPPWRFGVMLPGERARFQIGPRESGATIQNAVRCANQFGMHAT
ncbi:MAG: glycoside hydrolase family 2 protein [Pyrinomonadaceae bacterium]|nr:glycoside hydrolase family 2 protein [Phycisphaerales bacterium]